MVLVLFEMQTALSKIWTSDCRVDFFYDDNHYITSASRSWFGRMDFFFSPSPISIFFLQI